MEINSILAELKTISDKLRMEFASPIEIPESNTYLGLKERANQPTRQFKHLHQMCLLHVNHLVISGKIKLLALIDGYLASTDSGAVIAQYLFARTILEQCAIVNELSRRFIEIVRKPERNWMPKGEEFFSLAVRFRFSTGDKELQKVLESNGVPKKLLKPVNVMTCVASLASSPKLKRLIPIYDKFCDFVHHNGPSHFTTSSGFRIGDNALHFGSGGGFLMNKPGPITRYEYPTPTKGQKAIEDTVEFVLLAAKECVELLNELPHSPFPSHQIKEMTGNESGMVFLGWSMPK